MLSIVQEAEDRGDASSTLGQTMPESTASIASSILNYRTIHGRTYHADVGNAEYRQDLACLNVYHMMRDC